LNEYDKTPSSTKTFEKVTPEKGPIEDLEYSPELLAALGLNPGQNLYNVDLKKYIAANPADADYRSLLAPEELARYEALADIAGLQKDPTLQVGEYNPLAQIRKEDLAGTLKERQETFEKIKPQFDAQLQAITDIAKRNAGKGMNIDGYWYDGVNSVISARLLPLLDNFQSNPSAGNAKKILENLETLGYSNTGWSGHPELNEQTYALRMSLIPLMKTYIELNPTRTVSGGTTKEKEEDKVSK
jgi:hypothetical protein